MIYLLKKNVGTEKQKKDLLDKIHYLKKNKIGEADRSNVDCFRSNYEYGEELDWLREVIRDFVVDISEFYAERDIIFKTRVHNQTQQCDLSIKDFSFACTYNLQTEGTGNLVFINPANLLNDCNQKSPFIRDFKIEPKDGDLLIWPAWIPHLVEENKSNKQRINIATNIDLVGVNNE